MTPSVGDRSFSGAESPLSAEELENEAEEHGEIVGTDVGAGTKGSGSHLPASEADALEEEDGSPAAPSSAAILPPD